MGDSLHNKKGRETSYYCPSQKKRERVSSYILFLKKKGKERGRQLLIPG